MREEMAPLHTHTHTHTHTEVEGGERGRETERGREKCTIFGNTSFFQEAVPENSYIMPSLLLYLRL